MWKSLFCLHLDIEHLKVEISRSKSKYDKLIVRKIFLNSFLIYENKATLNS